MGSKTKLPAAATSRPAATGLTSRGPGVKAGALAESEAGLDHWGEQGSIYSSGLVTAAMEKILLRDDELRSMNKLRINLA